MTELVSDSDLSRRYEKLRSVLNSAYNQAAVGKGAIRHTDDVITAFHDQPICTITRQIGVAFPLGQAVKKIYETFNIGVKHASIAELLGAINYIAAAVIVLEERLAEDDPDLSEVQS